MSSARKERMFAVCTIQQVNSGKWLTRRTPVGQTLDKEVDDDYVLVPGKSQKTKTYPSNLAAAATRVDKVTVNGSTSRKPTAK